jgi:hypothetical protein
MRIPLKKSVGTTKKPQPFAVFDIEAYNWTKFRLCGHYDGHEYQEFRSMYEFIEYCWERPERTIYAHFGGIYDFMFVLECVMKETDYKIGPMIPRGSGLLALDVLRELPNGKIDKLSFRDSSALLPFSLKNLTESFGVKHIKKEFDFNTWDGGITKELSMYLKDDCRGLYECLKAFYEWPLVKKCGPAFTIASQAIKVFRLYLTHDIKSLDKKTDDFVRKSYFGGRTEVFKPEYNSKTKPIYCYDVNSLYPTIMRENEFPTNFQYMSRLYDKTKMGFWECDVEVPEDMYLPPLPIYTKVGLAEKLIFPTGKFSGVYTTGKGAVFKNGGRVFKSYIDDLYKMRRDAQKKGDGVTDILTKLMMNGTYGRFGLNTLKEQLVFDDFSTGLTEHSEISFEKDGKTRNYRLMTKPVELEKSFTNVAIASWVTSLSRVYMHKLMLPVQEHLYYTDTDSLFSTKKMKTGTGLGGVKEEYSGKQAIFLLPKTYVVEDSENDFKKVAMKGFDRRKIARFTYTDFLTALEGDTRLLKVTHDEKFAKFKTAARKGSFTSLTAEQVRQIRSRYDKRTIVKKGKAWDTVPLHLPL